VVGVAQHLPEQETRASSRRAGSVRPSRVSASTGQNVQGLKVPSPAGHAVPVGHGTVSIDESIGGEPSCGQGLADVVERAECALR